MVTPIRAIRPYRGNDLKHFVICRLLMSCGDGIGKQAGIFYWFSHSMWHKSQGKSFETSGRSFLIGNPTLRLLAGAR